MTSTPSLSISSAPSTNASSARSSSPPTNAFASSLNPRSARPAASTTRPNTLSATLSKTPSANSSQDKTPDQIAEMRFADIACGSGSFLLGVFDLLLTYHGHYYNENPRKPAKATASSATANSTFRSARNAKSCSTISTGWTLTPRPSRSANSRYTSNFSRKKPLASTHQYLLDLRTSHR